MRKTSLNDEEKLKEINESSKQGELHIHLRDEDGYLEEQDLKSYANNQAEIYICGGNSFLNSMMSNLKALGISEEKIHFETFVPRLSFSV